MRGLFWFMVGFLGFLWMYNALGAIMATTVMCLVIVIAPLVLLFALIKVVELVQWIFRIKS